MQTGRRRAMKAFVQRSLRLAAVLVLVLFTVSLADEGMWLLDQLKELDWKSLEKRGMKLSPREVYALKDAVVIIDGGTGEFVSPKGLVLTNHHVAFGALQRASTPEHNYIENGFLAKTMEEEIPIPGYEVLITQAFKDVTDEVKQVLKEGMSPVERFDALNRQMEKIREAAEKEP
ncbi:MAG TPA: serine protease, partial [Calditrichae bacterium]|nr:serine protease [Calditrichia bacterium]